MIWLILGIYIIGYIVTWVLSTGWVYAEHKRWKLLNTKEDWKETAGFAVVYCSLSSFIWPIFLPIIYCLTGFAQYGWIKVGKKVVG